MSNLPDFTVIPHCLFGEVRLCSRIISGFIEYQVSAGQQQIITWQNLLRLYKPLNSDGLFIPQNYDRINSTRVKIQYPDFLYLLDHQRNNRIRLNNLRFDQDELWYILYCLLETSHFCHKMNYYLGDVCGGTVVFNEYGRVKVFNGLTVPNYQSYVEKRSLRKSPELYRAGDNSTMINSLNRQKSQAFSIAMTMIEIALLCSLDSAYSNLPTIHQNLKKHLSDVRKIYDEFFVTILADMLIVDPVERSSSVQIYAILRPYSQQILNNKPFTPDPQKSLSSLKQYLTEDPPTSHSI